MSKYRIFWGETHDNTYQYPEQRPPIDTVMVEAAKQLDFYASAYYTACAEAFEEGGHPFESDAQQSLILEGWKPAERLEREWAEVQRACRGHNRPGKFVTFPGYEWQGDGSDGDHNVYHLTEGAPIIHVDRLTQLYERLRELDVDTLAIPHHTAYRAGVRGRVWSVIDESLSPFSEVYSVHGCSETDEEWIGLRQNNHMGPGVAGGTWQDALDRGLHLGAICSTDMWGGMPGRFGDGRMACLAEELTRESLWEAFKARRVYGVTGDRIALDFTVDGAPMGSIIECDGPRRISIHVTGSDALDRIELLRNGRVMATHCHQGTWRMPADGERSRFKLRVEAGWGPRPNEIAVPPRKWTGRLKLDGGRFTAWEPCWITPGQDRADLHGGTAEFAFRSTGETAAHRWQNANVFEFEATPETPIRLELNGLQCTGTMAEFAAGSRELWYRDECVRLLQQRCGLPPGSPEREDVYHHMAYKAKVHRAMPQAAWTAVMEIEDDALLEEEAHYRVRVEQRNGQRAWSSPIWVRPNRQTPNA